MGFERLNWLGIFKRSGWLVFSSGRSGDDSGGGDKPVEETVEDVFEKTVEEAVDKKSR